MRSGKIPDNTIRRLTRYYRALRELKRLGFDSVFSSELGDMLECSPSQVRQDLNFFGSFGMQGSGYDVSVLMDELAHILGIDRVRPAIIVGAGRIGTSLMEDSTLQQCGFGLRAAFDRDESLVGKRINGVPVMSMEKLPAIIHREHILLAALCVPADEAQDIASAVCSLGVKAVWNYTCRDLSLPYGIIQENIHFSDSILALGYRLARAAEDSSVAV